MLERQVVARAVLRAAGVEADEAENGAEAVRRVRERVGGAYDLILTDKQMPVMDGHEVHTRASDTRDGFCVRVFASPSAQAA